MHCSAVVVVVVVLICETDCDANSDDGDCVELLCALRLACYFDFE